MLVVPSLNTILISIQIQQAEEMLLAAQKNLEVERLRMAGAQADERTVNALMEFLGRHDERRSALFPFSSFRDDYISAGFGGINVGELERYEQYLQLVVSNARSSERLVQRLDDMVALLEKDIEQLKAVTGARFKGIYQYLGMKDLWWGHTVLSNPQGYGLELPRRSKGW